MIRFKFLTGDCNWLSYGGKWISNKQNNGDFDYWFVLELINWHEAVGEREAPAKYNVCLSVVSPQEAGEDNLKAAIHCYGMEDLADKLDNIGKVEVLYGYGISTPLWNKNGNNAHKLLKEGKKQAMPANFLFGFYMDRPVNAIGSTGWDAIKGDLTAGLNKA